MEVRRKIDGAVFNLWETGNPEITILRDGKEFKLTAVDLMDDFEPADGFSIFDSTDSVLSGSAGFDPVNKPEHYCNGGIECIDAMVITFGKKRVIIFCKLNAFKYRWRAPFKGKIQEDLAKAEWYIRKAEELSE